MKQFKFFALLTVTIFVAMSCNNKANTDNAASAPIQKADQVSQQSLTPPATINPAQAATEVPVGPLTTLEFAETSYDFGEVMEGEKVVHEYPFKNTGSEPLIISNAKGSCGCTVPDWPREPIPVGGSGVIKVQFDSKGKGKVGGQSQSKRVTITANTDPQNTYLEIKGKVNKEETAAPAQ